MRRALCVLMVAPIIASSVANAQTGGIQVAPVMITLTAQDNIASVRLRNTRNRPVSFEADIYEWRQLNGDDVLTPSAQIMLAPRVFEIPAGGEQVVRLGVANGATEVERAFRIVLRELPTQRAGNVLGFALELSLPIFVAPLDTHAAIEARTVASSAGAAVILANTGNAHIQIASVEDVDAGVLAAPRYLLAGSVAEVTISPQTRTVRVRGALAHGAQIERLIDVDASRSYASVR